MFDILFHVFWSYSYFVPIFLGVVLFQESVERDYGLSDFHIWTILNWLSPLDIYYFPAL
jgi:hypothetical protein